MRFRWRSRRRAAWALVSTGSDERWVTARLRGGAIDVRPGNGSAPARSFAAVIQDASVRHERLDLPPMASKYVEKAVREHCLTAQSEDDAIELSYAVNPDALNDILVVWAQRGAVRRTLDAMGERHARITRLLSPAVALAGLLRAAASRELRSDTSVLVHVGESVVSVASYDGSRIVLGREFPLPETSDSSDSTLGDKNSISITSAAVAVERSRDHKTDPLVEEIGRSILLFNHRLRGQRAARILLSSDGYALANLAAACRARFGLPASLLVEEVEFDLSTFGANSAEQTHWILPIAAAVTELTGTPDINLLPAEILGAQRQRAAHATLLVATCVALIVMAGQHGIYLVTAAALARSVNDHAALIEQSDHAVGDLAALYQAREIAAERSAVLTARLAPATAARELLAALSSAATDHLRIEELRILPVEAAPSELAVTVGGSITAENPAAAQAEFRLFHDRFVSQDTLDSLMLGPLRIEPGKEGNSLLHFGFSARIATEERSR